jgi:hypothetical protein
MSRPPRLLAAALIVAFAFSAAIACNGGGNDNGDDEDGGDTGTPVPTEQSARTVEPVEKRTETTVPNLRPTSTPAPPLGLTSFNYRVALTFDVVAPGDADGDGIEGTIEGAFRAPDSHSFTQRFTLGGITFNESLILIDGDAWYREGGDGPWEQLARDDPAVLNAIDLTSADPEFLGTDEELVDGIALLENELETLDGRLTHRYEFTQDDMASLSGLLDEDLLGGTTLEGVRNFLLRIWLDDITGAMRRAELSATLDPAAIGDVPFEVPAGADVEFRLIVDVTDTDDPSILIEPPV